jgi:hypothetical protein
MKNIEISDLAQILSQGLSEEVTLNAQVKFKTDFEKGNYAIFEYTGNISIKPIGVYTDIPRVYKIIPQELLLNKVSTNMEFKADNIIEYFNGTDDHRCTYQPYIKINLNNNPQSNIIIKEIKNIKY